jgi:hypothetical protein
MHVNWKELRSFAAFTISMILSAIGLSLVVLATTAVGYAIGHDTGGYIGAGAGVCLLIGLSFVEWGDNVDA